MSAETTKALKRRKGIDYWNQIFTGKGVDIGAGLDCLRQEDFPNITSIEDFDLKDGDAQFITQYRQENSYDFVHSSQCLEHMYDPLFALIEWIKLLKSGGYLVATFPDADLYEQGHWPSRYNHDHKHVFSINKKVHWCDQAINVMEMLAGLNNIEILDVNLIDTNYNYDLKNIDQTRGEAEAFVEIILRKKI